MQRSMTSTSRLKYLLAKASRGQLSGSPLRTGNRVIGARSGSAQSMVHGLCVLAFSALVRKHQYDGYRPAPELTQTNS